MDCHTYGLVAPVNISITVIPKALKYGHDIGSQAPISAQSHGQEVEARYGVEKNGPGKKKEKEGKNGDIAVPDIRRLAEVLALMDQALRGKPSPDAKRG